MLSIGAFIFSRSGVRRKRFVATSTSDTTSATSFRRVCAISASLACEARRRAASCALSAAWPASVPMPLTAWRVWPICCSALASAERAASVSPR